MAILQVFRDLSRPQEASQIYDPRDNITREKISETWIVQVDSKNYQPVDIFGASDGTRALPVPGQAYNLGMGSTVTAICDKVRPALSKESGQVFEVDVSYYIFTLPSATIKASLSSVPYPQTCYYDKDNKPIVNSAGQSFDPALTKTYYDQKFTLSYQSYTPPPIALILGSRGQVNSDSVTVSAGGWTQTFAERQLKLDDASAEFSYQGSQFLWSVSISFIVRTDNFQDMLLDQGYGYLDSSNTVQAIKDGNGDALNAQVQLDGHGHVLAAGATPVFLTFKVETETAMSGIIAAII